MDIQQANDFLIGAGVFGHVYRGVLYSGTSQALEVAVKCLEKVHKDG